MKLRFFAACVIGAAAFVSCQKIAGQDTPGNENTTPGGSAKVTLTVSFAAPEPTRVTFSDYFDSSEKEYYLQPRFEVGDGLMLIYESGAKADLAVTKVSASTATLEGEAVDGNARLVYIKDKAAKDWDGGMAIDYSGQTGCAEAAVYISAPGAISDGAGSFILANAGAILGISEARGLPAGAKVTGVTVNGSGLTSASVSEAFGLASANPSEAGSISAALSGFSVADGGLIVSPGGQAHPIFLALPAGASVTGVTLTTEAHGTWSIAGASGELAADSYVYVKGQLFGALPGEFSVSETKKVRFSQGNLQAEVDAKGAPVAWKFAASQTEFIGSGGANTSLASGTVDLFGWSTAATTFGISTDQSDATYGGSFKDWGKAFGESSPWRTLSQAEWNYLLTGRSVKGTAGTALDNTCTLTTVSSVKGLVIYPDGYTGDLANGNIPEGCVFLPAAGYRSAATITGSAKGYYWSGTEATVAADGTVYCLVFLDSAVYPGTDGIGNRCQGSSVRLVSDCL